MSSYIALQDACYDGNLTEVKRLIEEVGLNPLEKDSQALAWAAVSGRLDLVKYLISKGADPRADDSWALQHAVYCGHLDIVKYLVKQGAEPKAEDSRALIWAAHKGHTEIANFLRLWEKDDILHKTIREGLINE